ncbi:MAG: YraN family protein [Actinomycetota bacterium]
MRERVWREGEEAAWQNYRERGYRLLARNWRCPLGELDLVVARGRDVVFCEVKARRVSALGGPFEAVNRTKQRKLRALAQAFCSSERPRGDRYRFDVASVSVRSSGIDVYVFEDAF